MDKHAGATQTEAQEMHHEPITEDEQREIAASFRESKERGGQVVARQTDSENIYAESYKELYDALAERGIAFNDVTIDYVVPADESPIF
jgi:predicted lactoylglutathione lyase